MTIYTSSTNPEALEIAGKADTMEVRFTRCAHLEPLKPWILRLP